MGGLRVGRAKPTRCNGWALGTPTRNPGADYAAAFRAAMAAS
jgi:hypothetical protein